MSPRLANERPPRGRLRARSSRAVRRLAFTGAAVALLLIAVETALQVRLRRTWINPIPFDLRCTNLHETFYIALVPDYVGVSCYGIEHRTNAMGFRDDPIEPGRDQVFFLGDSTTFGLNIDHEQTYPELVEEGLSGVQCLNFATPGQGTISQLRVLDSLVRMEGLRPRAVVVGFFVNDFSNNMWFADYLEQRADRGEGGEVLPLGPVVRAERRFQSQLLRRAKSFLQELRQGQAFKPGLHNLTYEGEPDHPEHRNERGEFRFRPGREVEWDWVPAEELGDNRSFCTTVAALGEIAAHCERLGVPLVVLHLPYVPLGVLGERGSNYREPLERAAREAGVTEWLDGRRVYRDYLEAHELQALPSGFFSLRDDASHPGPLACRLLADALLPVLEQATQR